MQFEFFPFVFDVARPELLREGVPVPLSSRALTVLAVLLRERARIVSRDELLAQAWPGVAVSDGSLRQAIWELRNALGEHSEQTLRTVRGSGYRFIAELTKSASRSLDALADDMLVGREHELSQLREALAASTAGAGRTRVLCGPAGEGKSYLAQAFLSEARALGVRVLSARAERDEGAPPLWPWAEMLRGHLAHAPAALRQRCRVLAPTVDRVLLSGQLEESLDLAPDQRRFQLFSELLRVLLLLLEDAPLVLFVDDLHWADEASLAFLQRLARELPKHPLLLLVTVRPTVRRDNRALAQTLAELTRIDASAMLVLRTLSLDDLRRLVERQAGVAISLELAQRVHALSQGNALFSLELARLCARDGSGREALLGTPTLELCSVIQRRFSQLSERCLQTLLAASVWGSEFTLAELAALRDADEHTLHEALDEALSAAIFVERPAPGCFGFAHQLMREAAYLWMSRGERAGLHARAARWLDARGDELVTARIYELAHHYVLASSGALADEAIHYCARAAERACAATAYSEAVQLYERALAALDLAPEPRAEQRLTLQLARAVALRAKGAPTHDVNPLFRAVCDQALALGLGPLAARAALGYCGQRPTRFTPTRFWPSADPAEAGLLERALEGLGDADPALRALLLSSSAAALFYTPHEERRQQLLQQAVSIARELGDGPLLARVLYMRVMVDSHPSRAQAQLAACHELVALTLAHPESGLQLEAHNARALCALGVADRLGAQRDFRRVSELSQELGTHDAQVRAELWELFQALWEGRLGEVERLARRSLATSEGDVTQRSLLMARMMVVRYLREGTSSGELALARALLDTYPHAVGTRCTLASTYAVVGEHEAARREFDIVAEDDFARLPRGAFWLTELNALADAAHTLDDPARALLVYQQLEPFGDHIALYGWEAFAGGPVATQLGMLCTTLRRFDDAERWFRRGHMLCTSIGARLFAHLTEYEHASMLLRRGRKHDLERAASLCQHARAFASRRGLGLLTQRLDRIERALPVEARLEMGA